MLLVQKKHERLLTCKACPERERRCHGRCLCTLSGHDYLEHVGGIACPMGKYPAEGIGDVAARWFWRLGIGRLVYKAAGKTGCGCAKRQAQVNVRWRGMWEWVREWGRV